MKNRHPLSLLAGWFVLAAGLGYGDVPAPAPGQLHDLAGATPDEFSVASPDGRARATIVCRNGNLTYAVAWDGRALIAPSEISLWPGSKCTVGNAGRRDIDATWRPVWGESSAVRDHCRQLTLELAVASGAKVSLVCRVYDDGVGLRFEWPAAPVGEHGRKLSFRCQYRLPAASRFYFPDGEREPIGPVPFAQLGAKTTMIPIPVVAEAAPDIFLALLESDLFSAAGFEAMRLRPESAAAPTLVAESETAGADAPGVTPWRVLLFGHQPGALLASAVPLNLAAECQLADTGWIKPGKALWDWRVHGYRAGDFRYGINTASYKRCIDFAASNAIQYFLIDDGWFERGAGDRLEVAPAVDLTELRAYASEKGVALLLYYDRRRGAVSDGLLFNHLAGLGAKGVKYGFMGNDAAFTRRAIRLAADSRLHVDFHDQPCPMTGVQRTMPNALTREYCHSQQDSRRAFTPTSFLKMALINALTGPLDQANGAYGLDGINAGGRERGPLKPGSYNSTVVSETARVLVVFSGLICLPDAPEEYAKKADLFDFIRRMPPATWDETRILSSKIGHHLVTARRSGDAWFVGSVIDEQGGELEIPLDFLAANTAYEATFYEDAPASHYIENREAYRIRHGAVNQGQRIVARLAPGGGHCMWIRPREPVRK